MPLLFMHNTRLTIQHRPIRPHIPSDNQIYRHGFTILVLFLAAAIMMDGCSTPNLKPFADGAASFSTSIKETNTSVEIKFYDVAERQDKAKPSLTKYRDAVNIYNEMAGLAAAYSAALADLGAAGETGGEAAEQILQTVKGFSQFLDLASPGTSLPASLVGSAAGHAIKKAAELWNRLEARGKLLNTMSDADQAVQELATALVEVYGRPYKAGEITKYRPFEEIVRDIVLLERTALRTGIGRSKLSFYKQATQLLNGKVYSSASKALVEGDIKGTAKAFSDAQQILKEKSRIEGEMAVYLKADKVARDWQKKLT